MSNKKQVDYDQLFNLAKIGLTEEQIGVSLGISVATIGRRKKDDDRFADALKAGKQAGVTTVTNALYEGATGDKPSTSAQIFFLKNRAGWRDRAEIDANMSGNVVLEHDVNAALDTLREAGIDPEKI